MGPIGPGSGAQPYEVSTASLAVLDVTTLVKFCLGPVLILSFNPLSELLWKLFVALCFAFTIN